MELTPKEQAKKIKYDYWRILVKQSNSYDNGESVSIQCAKLDIQGKIDLLSELNQTKLCKFDKEIDYWNEVMKEMESL